MENKKIFFDTAIDLIEEGSDAFASVTLNPTFQWCKIIVCDDKPNANNQKVPAEEFANLLITGINAPIKMAKGKISDGHTDAFGNPIGAISNIKVDGNQVKALGALWKKERPEDIAALKQMYLNGTPPQVSWELTYTDSFVDDNGIENLKDISLNGLAIVGLPAYEGRTPIYAMASLEVEEITEELGEAAVWTTAYVNDLPDSCFLYVESGDKDESGKTVPRSKRHFPYKDKNGKVDLPHLRNAIARIPQSNASGLSPEKKTALQNKARKLLQEASSGKEVTLEELEKLQTELAEANAKIEQLEAMEAEIKELREYKAEAERIKVEAEKFAAIKEKFVKAGIEKDDEYFDSNKDMLLSLAEDALDFIIQEMVAFSSKIEKKDSSSSIPPVNSSDNNLNLNDPVVLAKELKKRFIKS